MTIDHDDPTPYQGVAEMLATSQETMLAPWDVRQVSAEDTAERLCRARQGHAVARLDAMLRSAPPEWQQVFAELDRRDPNSRRSVPRQQPPSGSWAVPVNYDPEDEPSLSDVAEAIAAASALPCADHDDAPEPYHGVAEMVPRCGDARLSGPERAHAFSVVSETLWLFDVWQVYPVCGGLEEVPR